MLTYYIFKNGLLIPFNKQYENIDLSDKSDDEVTTFTFTYPKQGDN